MEIINEVLKAEKEAELLIQQSTAQAAEMRRTSETQIDEMLKNARSRARDLLQKKVSDAQTLGKEERIKAIKTAEDEARIFRAGNSEQLKEIIREISGLIAGFKLP